MPKNIKILFGHAFYRAGLDKRYSEIISTAPSSLRITPCSLAIDPPGKNIMWPELESLWKKRDKKLMTLYEEIYKAAIGKDIFLNYNDLGIHPDFLKELPTKNIYCCFDDPKSSPLLSEPVAKFYDAVFHGNIASKFQYEKWGCKKISWLPNFLSPSEFPAEAERDNLLFEKRTNDIVFVGEKDRRKEKRLNELARSFPKATCYGRKGWDKPGISLEEKDLLYRTSRIGWNVHNSTGPINIRLFQLAAYGVMQICDNKTGLGQIFSLNDEAVGFDTIPEAIELTNFYLQHEELRAEIARNGYFRFWKDYHPTAIWKRIENQVNEWQLLPDEKKIEAPINLASESWRKVKRKKEFYKIKKAYSLAKKVLPFIIKKAKEKLANPVVLPQFQEEFYLGNKVQAYIENPEAGAVNLSRQRMETGLPLEWPNIVALNWTVTELINGAKDIVEIGSGTGAFAYYASVDKSRQITCFENDDFARDYASKRCQRPNVNFYKSYETGLRSNYDLLVSVEVIEHVDKVHDFLQFCRSLSKRAIITTPNRLAFQGEDHIGPPNYTYHVREYAPGELYWLLKEFYSEVYLYYMPDVYVPWIQPMNLSTKGTPIIAECID